MADSPQLPQSAFPTAPPGPPRVATTRTELLCSEKSYGTAVALSAVFGFLGIQHFYLGRLGEGLLDLGLSVGWLVCFVWGSAGLGVLLLALDFGHSTVVTILLLTGNFRDGQGRRVCYPGQKLEPWRQ